MRVLFLGATGTNKGEVVKSLADYMEQQRMPRPRIVDFEKEYLFNPDKTHGQVPYQLLNAQQLSQRRSWRDSWNLMCAESNLKTKDADLLLIVHGCIVGRYYGVRWIGEPNAIAKDFEPDHIVTLYDDVYNMWWRTEFRAKGGGFAGRPTLEQLLMARRTEISLGDHIGHSRGFFEIGAQAVRNELLSVNHPHETVLRMISRRSTERYVVYLSVPISAPREQLAGGDDRGVKEVNEAVRKAYLRQQENNWVVFVCPLSIDELPLISCADDHARQKEIEDPADAFDFHVEDRRWNLATLYGGQSSLGQGVSSESRCKVPVNQLEDARGMIRTDVGWRDFRLVEQADALAVFNPVAPGRDRISRGVEDEIIHAMTLSKPVFVYQDPKYDRRQLVRERFFASSGSMGGAPAKQFLTACNSWDEVLAEVSRQADERAGAGQ